MKFSEWFITNFWEKFELNGDCWVWVRQKNRQGYGRTKYRGTRYQAHRVAYEILHGEIPEGLYVCHRCDNPSCINPAHLFLGTNQVNILDAKDKGRLSYIKLTKDEVVAIRELYPAVRSYTKLARMFKVDRSHVRDIIKWKRRRDD